MNVTAHPRKMDAQADKTVVFVSIGLPRAPIACMFQQLDKSLQILDRNKHRKSGLIPLQKTVCVEVGRSCGMP